MRFVPQHILWIYTLEFHQTRVGTASERLAPFEFSSFVAMGVYPINWGHSGSFDIQEKEYLE